MGLLSLCLSKARRHASAAKGAGKPTRGSPEAACKADPPRCERPISPAELIAASAFLDFGGMFDERWLSGRQQPETGARRPRK
jgi:hypothetical protein